MKIKVILARALVLLFVVIGGLGCEVGYVIVGEVIDAEGKPISEVTIDFSNNAESVLTNQSGYWSKAKIIGPVVVTARKIGWTFSPDNHLVQEATKVDFIGTPEAVAQLGIVSKRRNALPYQWLISYLIGDLDFEIKMSPKSISILGDGDLSDIILDGALISRFQITVNLTHEKPSEIVVWVTSDGSTNRLTLDDSFTAVTHIWDGLTAKDRSFHVRIHDPVLNNNGKLNDVLIEIEWMILL